VLRNGLRALFISANRTVRCLLMKVVLARAQHRCCDPSQQTAATRQALDGFEGAVLEMFQQEWQKQRIDSMPG
jgi:hypothetical protein